MTMAEYINLDKALERLLFSMCGTGYQYDNPLNLLDCPKSECEKYFE